MKKLISVVIATLIVSGVVYVSWYNRVEAPGKETADAKQYSSSTYGITFKYPANYYIEERKVGEPGETHQELVLIEDVQDYDAKYPPGEGPTAITIGIFPNYAERHTSGSFIKNNSNSNYALGDGKISTTTRGSLTGLEYTWSGLYEGRSFVVAAPAYVFMFSVTRIAPEDKIISDFNDVVSTVGIFGAGGNH